MPVFIESLTTEFTVFDEDLPLSEAHIRQVAACVVQILDERERVQARQRSAARIDGGFEEAFDREEHDL